MPQPLFHRAERLMGNRFELTISASSEAEAAQNLALAVAEIQRIEAVLTTFSENSVTAAINRAAGKAPVEIPTEVFELIRRAQKISALTDGAFDLSYGSIDRSLWNFDPKMTALPSAETARRSVRLIDFRNIVLDENAQTVFLKNAGMRIGFGGIGKGYAADRAQAILKKNGAASGVVNASGDLAAWGLPPSGEPWTIGIADPAAREKPFSTFEITDRAVATSGDYEKFAVIDGRRFSHTIDPRTGLPVSGLRSVTVIAPSAELADALATPVMVLGRAAGLGLIDQMLGIAAIAVDETGRVFTTQNVRSVGDRNLQKP